MALGAKFKKKEKAKSMRGEKVQARKIEPGRERQGGVKT